jgi:hypothetical protein
VEMSSGPVPISVVPKPFYDPKKSLTGGGV